MKKIDKMYVNGQFVTPHGTEVFELINPSTQDKIGEVVLGDETDVQQAVAAAKAAFSGLAATSRDERIAMLERLRDAIANRKEELIDTMVLEYGGTRTFCTFSILGTIDNFTNAITVLKSFAFERKVGSALVAMQPVGVAGIITPWNASCGAVCNKLSAAIVAGCTTVIKPSEMSALQTQLLVECFDAAQLPAGVINVVNGRGDVVGAAITGSADVAKISFTGSTAVGKGIARTAADSIKRFTLELGGKSPNIILDVDDLKATVAGAVQAAFMNSGQACIAGSRLLVPAEKLEEVKVLVKEVVGNLKTGNPQDTDTAIGPMVSRKQYDRVQQYIQLGIDAGAELVIGGTGHPAGLENGNFVKPTVFAHVTNDMRIAREEIFGPVLSIISYTSEEEAIAIANDTDYGLYAYVNAADTEKAKRVAARINAGRVAINGFKHDPMAPFGGFKQSGVGREYGAYGVEAYLEPKAILL